MSYARKKHASMMESQQKKAAEEAAESLLAATASLAHSSSSVQPAAVDAPATATHTQPSASIQHDDFAEDSSDDDSDSEAGGIAFLQASSAGVKKAKLSTKTPTSTIVGTTSANTSANVGSASAPSAAVQPPSVMSLQRMHWTKEMVLLCRRAGV
jgi:hypothetical protein